MAHINAKTIGILAVATALIAGCAGTKTVTIETNADKGMAVSVPEAFDKNYAQDTTAIYGKGTALSNDMQTSIDKATMIASAEIATFLEAKVERYRDYLVREPDNAKAVISYSNATKEIVSQSLQGTEEHFRKLYKEDGSYRAYVILKLPIGKSNKALLDQIQKNEELMTRYKNELQLKQLEEEVRRYEASKRKQ